MESHHRRSRAFDQDLVSLGGLLTTLMMVATLAQFSLGALAPSITDEFGLSRTSLGLVNLAYYSLVAGFSLILSGPLHLLSDRMAASLIMFTSMAGLISLALAPTYWSLLAGLLLGAAAGAAANPVTNRAALPTGHAKAALIAFKQSGVAVSTILCGSLLPPLTDAIGWRRALLTFSSICLVPMLMIRSARHRSRDDENVTRHHAVAYSVPQLAIYAFFMGSGSATVTGYLALFARQALRADASAAGLLLSAVGAGAIGGRVIWGAAAIRATRRGKHLRRLLGYMGAIAALSSVGMTLSMSTGIWLAWMCAFLLGLSASSWNPLAMMIVASSGQSQPTMRASGQVLFGFFGGLAIASPVFGAAVDGLGYGAAWLLTASLFLAAVLTIARPSGTRQTVGVQDVS